nr:PrGVORF55 [Darna trima granulovirus]
MSSLKELYFEILKTQQDIAVTYGRVVAVENELKKKLSEDNKNDSIDERLDKLQQQLNDVVTLLKQKYQENDTHYEVDELDEAESAEIQVAQDSNSDSKFKI